MFRRWDRRTRSAIARGVIVTVVLTSCGAEAGRPSTRKVRVTTTTEAPKRTTTTTVRRTPKSTTSTTMPPRAKPLTLKPTDSGPLDNKIIVLDPGHNGRNYQFIDVNRPVPKGADPELCNTAGAATGAGLNESEIVWDITERVTPILRRAGATVILTRPDNEGFGPCADERGLVANRAKADAFVSIHADGDESGGSGFHIARPAPRPRLSSETVDNSEILAVDLANRLIRAGLAPSNYTGENGVKVRDNLANLNVADRPAVLAELGNLVNPIDSTMLSTPSNYDVIANAIVLALLDFLATSTDGDRDVNGDGTVDVSATMTLPTTTTVPPPTFPVTEAPTIVPTTQYTPPVVITTRPPRTIVPPTRPSTTTTTTATTTTATTTLPAGLNAPA